MEGSTLGGEERSSLLALARRAIVARLEGRSRPALAHEQITPALAAERACFVTLHKGGALRGCIGTLTPREPLHQAVARHAQSAAFEDSRFAPVRAGELPGITLEISVLTLPAPLVFEDEEDLLRRLRPGVDGVVLRANGLQATFLPQVWEQLPEPHTFLEHLSRKAGAPGLWRESGAEVLRYEVECFEEC